MLCPESTAIQAYSDSPTAVSMRGHGDLFRDLADDQVREDLVARPVETLAAYGIHLDRRLVPTNVTLPKKDTFMRCAVEWMGFF